MNERMTKNRKTIRESATFVIDSDFWFRHSDFAAANGSGILQLDLRPQDFQELRQPVRVRGPGGGGAEVFLSTWALSMSMERKSEPAAVDVGADGRIGVQERPFQYIGCDENLDGVADGGDGFVRLEEMTDELDDAGVKAEIFGARPPGRRGLVYSGRISSKVAFEGEVVAGLFGVGLIAFKS